MVFQHGVSLNLCNECFFNQISILFDPECKKLNEKKNVCEHEMMLAC